MTTVAQVLDAFYRLTGSASEDEALVAHGEAVDEVALEFLTRGCWAAQEYMLEQGYQGWRKRSSAISWSGADATDGGRYWALPSDFLRAYGNGMKSCLVEADGDGWGQEIRADEDHYRGPYYYIRGAPGDAAARLWITKDASPPSPLYLSYHYTHPTWTALVTIDFPTRNLPLVVAEAANVAKEEDWLPEREAELRIDRAVKLARLEAVKSCRTSKQPRGFRKPYRAGNHW